MFKEVFQIIRTLMVQSGWLSLGVKCKTQGDVFTFPIFTFSVQQMALQPQYVTVAWGAYTAAFRMHCSLST